MTLRVASLGSGSRGNAFLIEGGGASVLIDAGFSGAQLARRLGELGVAPESIELAVITHEHRDHSAGAGIAARRWGWPLAMTEGTRRACASLLTVDETVVPLPRRGFAVSELRIDAAPTNHDAADPVAVTVADAASGLRVGIATDLGRPTTPVRAALGGCHFLVLEANHDERWLRAAPYPWSVKQRIGGSRGHLSNRHAADLARELAHPGLGGILLAHLSHECNEPSLALDWVGRGLARAGYRGLLHAASQDQPSAFYDVGTLAARSPGGSQLALFPR